MVKQLKTTGTTITPEDDELEEDGYVNKARNEIKAEQRPPQKEISRMTIFQEIEELKKMKGKADQKIIHTYNRLFTLKGQLTRAKKSEDLEMVSHLVCLFNTLEKAWFE